MNCTKLHERERDKITEKNSKIVNSDNNNNNNFKKKLPIWVYGFSRNDRLLDLRSKNLKDIEELREDLLPRSIESGNGQEAPSVFYFS